ncbi:uncharacterized protein LOC143448460 isoform X2 [Clavelina lepadiformis]|uniref:uncharacterized protein LOC143448460 isoform X2 n=1 Tax=Clavelina lepadiformis TaxID=159417 RepID=UPI004041DBD0
MSVHCHSTKIHKRCVFLKRKQLPNETVAEYKTALFELAESCKYGDFYDDAITQQFVFGLWNKKIQHTLLKEEDLDFTKATRMAKTLEEKFDRCQMEEDSNLCDGNDEQFDNSFKEEIDGKDEDISRNVTVIEIDTNDTTEKREHLPTVSNELKQKSTSWWVHGVQAEHQPYFGYCFTVEDAQRVLRAFEQATSSKFVVLKKEKFFDINAANHQIRFEGITSKTNVPTVPYLGIPFIALASRVYECQYGIDRHFEQKREKKLKNKLLNKSRSSLQPSFKRNCPAKVTMREIVLFPQYKISKNVLYHKKHASKKVREALKSNLPMEVEQRIYVALPPRDHHENHFVDEY